MSRNRPHRVPKGDDSPNHQPRACPAFVEDPQGVAIARPRKQDKSGTAALEPSSRHNGTAIGVSGTAQTSRDSPAAVIPQVVTPRTRRAGRSGTHKAHARGGAGAGEPPRLPLGVRRDSM